MHPVGAGYIQPVGHRKFVRIRPKWCNLTGFAAGPDISVPYNPLSANYPLNRNLHSETHHPNSSKFRQDTNQNDKEKENDNDKENDKDKENEKENENDKENENEKENDNDESYHDSWKMGVRQQRDYDSGIFCLYYIHRIPQSLSLR